jgi:hypothetical protein
MNNLSWFIYLVQLVDAATVVFVWAAVLTILHFIVQIIITAIRGESAWINATSGDTSRREARNTVWKSWNPRIAQHAMAFMACVAIAGAIPSRQTMILIAGSEMGERALKSDVVSDGMKLVNLWIKQETDKIKKKAVE